MGHPGKGRPAARSWSVSGLGRAMTWVSIAVAVLVPLVVVVLAVAGRWAAWWLPVAFVAMGGLWLRQTAWAATAVELTDHGELRLSRPVGPRTVPVEQVVQVRRSLWGGEGSSGGQVLVVTEQGSVPLSLGLTRAQEIADAIQARNPHVKITL